MRRCACSWGTAGRCYPHCRSLGEDLGRTQTSGGCLPVTITTLGWEASCSCRDAGIVPPVIPAVVLDPFGGSGTTGRVAVGNGRSAICIELNPDYAGLTQELGGTLFGQVEME